MKKDKRIIKIPREILKKIERICRTFMNLIWIPFAGLIICFLGYLQSKFHYETTLVEDCAKSFGLAINSLYTIGATRIPGWFWIIFWIGLLTLGIWDIIDIWRKNGKRNKKQEKKEVKRKEEVSV